MSISLMVDDHTFNVSRHRQIYPLQNSFTKKRELGKKFKVYSDDTVLFNNHQHLNICSIMIVIFYLYSASRTLSHKSHTPCRELPLFITY